MKRNRYEVNNIELVITPPEPYGTYIAHRFFARTTLGVLTQLVAKAKTYIIMASPFLQTSKGLSASPLIDALKHALSRDIRLDIISTEEGIKIYKGGWSGLLGNGRIRLFQPKSSIEDERLLVLHAKVLVADGQHVYIGSANLTQPGLTGNLEMGILLHGDIAAKVASFWQYLVDIEFIVEV